MSGWPGGLGGPGKAQVALKGFELCWFKLLLRKATTGADGGWTRVPMPGLSQPLCWQWDGVAAPLVLLEVELGDNDGLLGPIGEADGLVCLQSRAQEPARAGSRLEAGGGAAVCANEGEALALLLRPAQVSDVDFLGAGVDR